MAGETPTRTDAPAETASDWYKPSAEPDWDSLTEAGKEHGDKLATEPESKEAGKEKEKSFNERELDRIARLTGRVPDDPEVLKLNLVLRYQKFQQYRELHDGQKEKHIMIQQQTYEDIATAKRELEEAMYLYDESFRKADERIAGLTEEQRRHNAKDRLRADKHFGEGTAMDADSRADSPRESTASTTENSWVRARLERNRVYNGKREGVENDRQGKADHLYDDLARISTDIRDDEIFKTYELRKDEAPEEPITGRRDGYNAGKDGLFITDKDGHMAPERPVDWSLYPHAPKSAESTPGAEGEGSAEGDGTKKPEGPDGPTGPDDSTKPGGPDGPDGPGGPGGPASPEGPTDPTELDKARERELELARARELELKKAMEAEIAGMSEAERDKDLAETEARLKDAEAELAIHEELTGKTEEELNKDLEETDAALKAKRARLKEVEDLLADDEPLVAVNADFSLDKKDLAHDLAEQELNKEVAGAGALKRLWKGTLFKKYFELKYTKQFESGDREVEIEGKKYGVEDLIAGRKDAAIKRFVMGVVEDNHAYIHDKAGEEMKPADEETTAIIKKVIENFATFEIPEGHSLDDLKLVFRNKMNELKAISRDRGDETEPLLFDNYLEVAVKARERFEHGMAIEDVMEGFRVVNATARDGIRTEAHRDALDRLINRAESGALGQFIPAEAIAAGVGIVAALTQPGSRALLGAAGGIGVSSVLAGLKERNRVTEDRARMLRDIANGMNYEGEGAESPRGRTARYEKRIGDTLYATEKASDLTANIEKALSMEGEGKSDAILRAIAEARVRIDFSDAERKDLIAYSSEDKRGDERLALDIATIRAEKALSDDDKRKLESIKAQIKREVSEDVDEKDDDFTRTRRRIATGKAIKTLALGAGVFFISQEAMALADPTKVGILEKLGVKVRENAEGAENTILGAGLDRIRGGNLQPTGFTEPFPVSADDPTAIERYTDNGYEVVSRTPGTTKPIRTFEQVSPAASDHQIRTAIQYANNGTNWSDGAELALHAGRDGLYADMAGMTSTMNGQSFDIDALTAAGRVKGFVTVNGATFEVSPSLTHGVLSWGENGVFTTTAGDTMRLMTENGAPLYDSFMVAVDNGDIDGVRQLVSLSTHVAGGGFHGTMNQVVDSFKTTADTLWFSKPIGGVAPHVNVNGLAFAPITARTGLGEARRASAPAEAPAPARAPESRAPSVPPATGESGPAESAPTPAEPAPSPAESAPASGAPAEEEPAPVEEKPEEKPAEEAPESAPAEESDRYESPYEIRSKHPEEYLSDDQKSLLEEVLNDDEAKGVPPEVIKWISEPDEVDRVRSDDESDEQDRKFAEWWSKQSEEARIATGKFIRMITRRNRENTKRMSEFGKKFMLWMTSNHNDYTSR